MAQGQRVTQFDTWKPTYGGAIVEILRAGTTDLLTIYADPNLTTEIANPVTLISQTVNNTNYGKFAAPVYVGEAYYLKINSVDETGVSTPSITTLVGQDASQALVSTARGLTARKLEDLLDQVIYASDFGEIGGTSATNTTTLNAAIGAASAQGGGQVVLPAGTIPFTTLSLSEGVILVGQGRTATLLQSSEGQAVITIGGDAAGLMNLTLDGLNLVAGSIGIESVANDFVVMQSVEVKRFETNGRFKGGRYFNWRDVIVSNGGDGFLCHGDGAPVEHNVWRGGAVQQHTGTGLEFKFVDDVVRFNRIERVLFDSNVATAVNIDGARYTSFGQCAWANNITDLNVKDGTDTSEADRNTVIGLDIEDSEVDGGTLTFDDTCDLVYFRRCDFDGATFDMQLPDNFVQLIDCTESASVAITSNAKQLTRNRANTVGEVAGVTSGAVTITAWEYALEPGQVVYVEAKVKANQRDGQDYGITHIACGARRPGSLLNFDAQTSNFTIGSVLTGQTSQATARIVAMTDSGANGTLTLRDIVGVFEDNEIITDAGGGSATADGILSAQNAVLSPGGEASIRPKSTSMGDLGYDNQTANFTVGKTLTGGTSGATAVITNDVDSGTDGTLTLKEIAGTFQNNETITDSSGGSALANGTVIYQGVDAAFDVSGGKIRLRATGATGDIYEWRARVEVFE